jgi:hypothetical protein
MTTVHLGFDMGIRNLAYCLIEHRSNDTWSVLAWDNVDLLSGGQSAQTARRCVGCNGPAVFHGEDALWCKGCATGVRRKKSATRIPTLPALPCPVVAKDLKKLGVTGGWATAKTKKEELVLEATNRYLMPWKAPKATSPSLAHIRRCMDTWLTSMLPTFAKADLIRLENQPVMKGPTMKSIQIMLFTLLGHRLEKEFAWRGEIVFVHAGTKTKAAEAAQIEDVPEVAEGDTEMADDGKAYRARKKTAEVETESALEAAGATEWLMMFRSRSKKSDLADAFLMALRK